MTKRSDATKQDFFISSLGIDIDTTHDLSLKKMKLFFAIVIELPVHGL